MTWSLPRTATFGRVAYPAVAVACLVLGLRSEQLAFGWANPAWWIPDLMVGLTFLYTGVSSVMDSHGIGSLLTATGLAWFAGNLTPVALFWHRAPLIHLILVHGAAGPRSRTVTVSIVIGYASAVVPVWRNDLATVLLAVSLMAVVLRERYMSPAGAGRQRSAAWYAVALGGVLVVGAGVRTLGTTRAHAIPVLWAYECVLAGIAIGMLANVGTRASLVADLVVELGESPSGALRDSLARLLGDPSLRIGYWRAATRDYVDPSGTHLDLPLAGDVRTVRRIGSDDQPSAVLIHDPALLSDPALLRAVESAAQLTASNAALHRRLGAVLADVVTSRRRVLHAGDDQQALLMRRICLGPGVRLARVHEALDAAPENSSGSVTESLRRARSHLAASTHQLFILARGLHPPELSDGLGAALAALVERSPVRVSLTMPDERFPARVEAAAYFACAEALANVIKYASASTVSIEVVRSGDELSVVVDDDGVGGADAGRGSGLTGLVDRFDALGGRIAVVPGVPTGTRVVGTIPLAPPWRIDLGTAGGKSQ